MSAERLKLVESFAELRAGMIVVTRISRLRAMLVKFHPAGTWDPADNVDEDGWEMLPRAPDCRGDTRSMICPSAVRRRNVYRVEDGLEDADTAQSRTRRPKVRQQPARTR